MIVTVISKKGKLTNLKKSPFGEEDYDSALEREYMIELERDAAVVKWTKKHGIKIPYTLLGFRRHYLPERMTVLVVGDSAGFDRPLSELGPVNEIDLEALRRPR